MDGPRWRTTAEVAEELRTSEGTVRYWRHVGYGPPSVKIGRRVLYDAGELERWLAAQARKQGSAA